MQIEYKDGNMPLTVADKKANSIIISRLQKNFSDYAILSEKKDRKDRLKNDFCFVLDPLDGTKEFIKRNGQFAVNVALAYKHRTVLGVIVLGVIYVPVTGELYYATQGGGAYKVCADEEQKSIGVAASWRDTEAEELQVSNNSECSSLRVVLSNSHGCAQMDELLEKYRWTNFVKVGSSLKGCMVANGEVDIYYRYNATMEWDTVAMQCIVEETGGILRQMDGAEMLYNRENRLVEKGLYVINCEENHLD